MKINIPNIIDKFIHESRNALQDNVVREYLFGSYATGMQTPLSDIDILIIVKSLTPDIQSKVSGLASDYALKYDICFSPILTDTGIWKKIKNIKHCFIKKSFGMETGCE